MSGEAYERYQLELILLEYSRRGFDISQDVQMEFSNMRFDAVAKNKSSGQLIIIELVNKAQSRERATERIDTIRRLAQAYPDAQVDLRYIHVEKSRVQWWRNTVGESHEESFKHAINRRLPRRPKDAGRWTMYFMQVWTLHIATIRAYDQIVNLLTAPPMRIGALEIYNDLLHLGMLHPPEDLIEGVDLNLFDLHEAVLAIADGAIINTRYLENLVQHFHSVRQQARKWMKPMPKLKDLPKEE